MPDTTTDGRAAAGASERAVTAQRLVLVLPSTGEFDSRTYRIATSALARGHEVTVLARWKDGLPVEERHPTGYRVVRVRASAIDGLPFPMLRAPLARWLARRRASRRLPDPTPAAESMDAAPGEVTQPAGPPRRASLVRRVSSEVVRRLAIPLTIRSHIRNARAVAPEADIYHGMAYMGIPIALDLARRHRALAVYDARDIYLEARNIARMRGPARWWLARAERRWAHRAARVLTVNDAYADVLAGRFGTRPLVVMNCSYRFEPPAEPDYRFHDALGLSHDVPIALYHGGLFPERGIEQLIEAIQIVDGVVLVLMGYGALEPELRAMAGTPTAGGRVHVLPAVTPQDLHAWVAAADVAVMPIQPTTLNHRLTTPNKLFEAMTAGVPIVASDLPGMAGIIRAVDCGRLVDPTDPVSIADGIRDIISLSTPDRAAMREREREAARTTYNWESQAERLFEEYTRITGRSW